MNERHDNGSIKILCLQSAFADYETLEKFVDGITNFVVYALFIIVLLLCNCLMRRKPIYIC